MYLFLLAIINCAEVKRLKNEINYCKELSSCYARSYLIKTKKIGHIDISKNVKETLPLANKALNYKQTEYEKINELKKLKKESDNISITFVIRKWWKKFYNRFTKNKYLNKLLLT